MPRRSGGGGGGRAPASRAPPRPTPVAPQRANPSPPSTTQNRGASTAASPAGAQNPTQQQSGRSSGLFGQMASTAAGVAIGSSIGHALGGMFGGGQQQQDPALGQDNATGMQQDQGYGGYSNQNTMEKGARCDLQAKDFTKCLEDNKGSDYQMTMCAYYLDQLKACQAAASRY